MPAVIKIVSACLLSALLSSCSLEQGLSSVHPVYSVFVKKPIGLQRNDAVVVVSVTELVGYNNDEVARLMVLSGDQEVASQVRDVNDDGIIDKVLFVASFEPNAKREFALKLGSSLIGNRNYPNRTHAELSQRFGGALVDGIYIGGEFKSVIREQLPRQHSIGDMLYRYEGPGWESDKIAYRLYFDERNVIDIFGKTTADIVLPSVGHSGYSYHQPADWGLDILKVGDSLGIGGLGMMHEGLVHRVSTVNNRTVEITDDNTLRSGFEIFHQGWTLGSQSFDLTSRLSILAGSRLTHHQVAISNNAENLVAGIVKHAKAKPVFASSAGAWSYVASYGQQSYVNDELGMAILFRQNNLIEITEDDNNYLVVMKPEKGELNYYFLATWAQEPGGIKTAQAFLEYLDETIKRLEFPLEITMAATGH